MVFVQTWPFSKAKEMCLMIFQTEKTPFQAIKTKSSKDEKLSFFFKGVSPWFLSKIRHFSIFIYYLIQAKKMCFMIFQTEKTPCQAIKTKSLKVEKLRFFQRGQSMVFVQKLTIFPCFFLLVNLGKENVFYDILDQKNFFLRYKNKKFKKSKNKDFSKTVSPWFFFKTGHFLLVNLGKENVFSILDRKNALLGYKNKKSKKSKN